MKASILLRLVPCGEEGLLSAQVQIAEIDGRLGRVVRIKAIEETDSEAVGRPSNFISQHAAWWECYCIFLPPGGWMDLYTEAGWSCLRH